MSSAERKERAKEISVILNSARYVARYDFKLLGVTPLLPEYRSELVLVEVSGIPLVSKACGKRTC